MTEIVPISCGMSNCYLVLGPKGVVLVDSGGKGSLANIARGLAQKGKTLQDITLLLLTHNHSDHTGAAEYLRREHGIPVGLHPDDGHGGQPLTAGEGMRGKLLYAFSARAVKKAPPVEYDVALADGMDLSPYGVEAWVVHVPGHTVGSVGVLLADKQFVAGDMYMNHMGPAPAYIAEDFKKLAWSNEKLHRLGVAKVWPGHGAPFALQGKG